jgi:aryl-alcohol dehydrogenase-like predicted oxidoreductase
MSLPDNQLKLEAADKLAGLAAEAGMSLIHLALGFVLSHPAVTSAIIGPRTMEHLDGQLGAPVDGLPADVLDRIDEIVPPGVNLSPADRGYQPPSLTDASLRRRRVG